MEAIQKLPSKKGSGGHNKEGRFWRAVKSYCTCFVPVNSRTRNYSNKRVFDGITQWNSTVHSATSSPYGYCTSPSGMSPQEADESIKAAILYCRNNSKPSTWPQELPIYSGIIKKAREGSGTLWSVIDTRRL